MSGGTTHATTLPVEEEFPLDLPRGILDPKVEAYLRKLREHNRLLARAINLVGAGMLARKTVSAWDTSTTTITGSAGTNLKEVVVTCDIPYYVVAYGQSRFVMSSAADVPFTEGPRLGIVAGAGSVASTVNVYGTFSPGGLTLTPGWIATLTALAHVGPFAARATTTMRLNAAHNNPMNITFLRADNPGLFVRVEPYVPNG